MSVSRKQDAPLEPSGRAASGMRRQKDRFRMIRKLVLMTAVMPLMALAATLTDGLVAYWPFDGNANDASGNGNHGTTHGVTLTTDRFGNANGAYYFGQNHYISVPDSSSLDSVSAELTISAWVRVDEWVREGWASIVNKSDGDYARYYAFNFGNGNAEPANGFGTIEISSDISGYSDAIPQLGEWTHMAVTYGQNGVLYTYLNGVCVGTYQNSVSLFRPNTAELHIGRDRVGGDDYLAGAIDELRIYNRALSAAEVKALYEGASVTPTGNHGLSISYYDAGNLTTLRSFDMGSATYEDTINFFETMTPSLVTNTSDIGECLDFCNTDGTCKFHGKYAKYATDYFWSFMKGYIVLAEAGLYEFGFDCDDSCVIYIDGQKVVGSPNNYDSGGSFQEYASVWLSAGTHAIVIVYGESDYGHGLTVYMKRPSESTASPLPQSILYDGTAVTPPPIPPATGLWTVTQYNLTENILGENLQETDS